MDRSPVLLRLRAPLKQQAQAEAQRQARSLNSYLEFLIIKDLGIDFPQPQPEEALDLDFLQ
jgi:hypothetical protein